MQDFVCWRCEPEACVNLMDGHWLRVVLPSFFIASFGLVSAQCQVLHSRNGRSPHTLLKQINL